MVFDLGLTGLGILVAFALAFGALAQLITRRSTHWMWLTAAIGWFIGGLFVSEVMYATYTEDQIQPIIDGLAFDESLLGGLMAGLAAVVATWVVIREFRSESPAA